jgi:threonine/homoserine/homoserine lactone efflux protein
MMISMEFLITSFIVVVMPGTGVIYTISTGLIRGTRAGVFAATGCTAGIIPSLLACILGVAVIIHTSALAFQTLKFAGVAYLLYLAWSMWRQTGTLELKAEQKGKTMFRTAFKGFLINILNPKLTVFFLAFLPQFIPARAPVPILNMLVLGGVFMGMTWVVFIGYALLADKARTWIVNSPAKVRNVQRTFAVMFAVLGAKLALSGR